MSQGCHIFKFISNRKTLVEDLRKVRKGTYYCHYSWAVC